MLFQKDILERLKSIEASGHMPHAMLFCGPKGCGKMPVALEFARYLLCQGEGEKPCGHCPQCAMLKTWEHPDLHFFYPVSRIQGIAAEHKMVSDDYARQWYDMLREDVFFDLNQWLERMDAGNKQAQIGIGDADALIRKLSLKSSQGGYKVFIIWLPERMNQECANAMLKSIEEPPSQTVYIMVCEEPDNLLETIISRTQRIDFKAIPEKQIAEALEKERFIPADIARSSARSANGSWMKALSMISATSENKQFLELYINLMRMSYARNLRGLKEWAMNVATEMGREQQGRMLDYFLHMTRENFMHNFNIPDLIYMSQDEKAFATKFARFINETNVVEFAELFTTTKRDIRQNANPKFQFFSMAVKVIMLLARKQR